MDPKHTVVAGETLASIASHAYRSAEAVLPLALVNGLLPGAALAEGDELDLPLRLVGLGGFGAFLVHLLPFVRVRILVTSTTTHFAPGPELFDGGDPTQVIPGEECEIQYEIDDELAQITAARLEVVREADPGVVLYQRELEAGDWAPGAHTLRWDGRCSEGDATDRFIHPVHSPYRVRIVGTTATGDATGHGLTRVLLHSLQVRRGPYVDPATPPAPGSDAHYQLRLNLLGYHAGEVDGKLGSKSSRAVRDFQRDHQGLRVTGNLDTNTKAWLDGQAPPGTGTARYQFILDYLGFRCGTIDGLAGRKTRRAVEAYRAARGLPPGDALDGATRASLDGEALPPPAAREVLEDDLTAAAVHENDLPAPGAEKKVFVYCDGAVSPGDLPYNEKHQREADTLVRPHLPVTVVPLIQKIDGSPAFSAHASGPMRIDFTVDPSPPPADLGIPNATSRAYVQTQLGLDGNQATTGHHAHENRGGIRKDDDPGVFLLGKRYGSYEVEADGHLRHCTCVEAEGAPARGTAGVLFAPSTIAGDRFALVIEAHGAAFDEAPNPAVRHTTGWMVVWRRYRISKLWLMEYVGRPHRTETSPDLGLGPWFDPAFIDFVEPAADPQPRMIAPRNADHRAIDLPFYTALLRGAGYRPAQLPDAQIQARFAANILWPLSPAAVLDPADEQAYYDAIDIEIMAFEERFADTLRELSALEEPGGLVALVFDENAPAAGTMGISAMVNPSYQSWAWSVLASEGVVHLIFDQDTAPGAIDGETLAHEIGHALWLHHASTAAGSNPHVDDQPEHNPPEWQTCTMSYVSLAQFCGKCVLKLRGFDESTV